ncbi:2-dehydropantoate 2-reductase [Williamsia sp. 1138]|uniref:ketopantoate reductase family protein n=1 Tax=Williamsia sp. 1138 TaxID=1903117 RepID=UPI000A100B64|nr:2-dehydropantoate 2-reductase [Williamsia sp. 1138]OZG27563.1 2-dehydropantoate 2-reductase [Williamsia sp. 1138]
MAKVAIVGCGAMGSVYAGLMQEAGHEVHGVTLWTDHVAAVNAAGLRVYGDSGDRTVRLASMSTTADAIGECDLVIIATKSFDAEAAAKSAAALIGPDTVVQTIQNGLGSPDVVANSIDPDQIAVGVVGGFGASIPTPGQAHHNGREITRFGAYRGLSRERLEFGAQVWSSAGFKVALFDDIDQMVWEKLLINVAFSGSSFLTGLTIAQIINDPKAWRVASACALEALDVANALGVTIDVGDPIEYIRTLGLRIGDAKPSMRLDAELRRRAEVDAINGSIVRIGAETGVPTPVNSVVVDLAHAAESAYIHEADVTRIG